MASALKLITKEPDATPVRLTSVEPLRSKKPRGGFDVSVVVVMTVVAEVIKADLLIVIANAAQNVLQVKEHVNKSVFDA